ncbi:unnamed protein product [Bemisia tabaci]|uniref:UV-stimulated scaffold protein A C-terminal domain-containing protein n=1 Tax=Bemisia tabaci TaxID=7038 RepID=A0A9P0A8K7_BEMTA|nr:unnamed protein product [Bemisia tabaci]
MASTAADPEVLFELENLVEDLTHSGQKTLDASKLKRLKSICKQSSSYIERMYTLVMDFMKKDHAEIRFSAFQICDEFFRRSHLFRELIIADLQQIFELTAEINAKNRMPPPRKVAENLKKMALKTVKEWNSVYGPAYKRLSLGLQYLQKCAKINFERLEREESLTRDLNRQIERRKRMEIEAKLIKLHAEISENETEIRMAVNALEACMGILVPRLNDFSLDDEDGSFSTEKPSTSAESTSSSKVAVEEENFAIEDEANLEYRERGMSSKYAIEICLNEGPVIHESSENKAVLENAVDQHKLLSKKEDLEKVVDLKKKVEQVVQKFKTLKIIKMRGEDEVSTDSELEDVPIDETVVLAAEDPNKEANIKDPKLSEAASTNDKTCETASQKGVVAKDSNAWSILSTEEKAEDPTSAQAALHSLKKTPKKSKKPKAEESKSSSEECSPTKLSERKKKLLALAPKVPFDIDLYHWEENDVKAPTLIGNGSEGHRFWSSVSAEDMQEIPVPDGAASLRTRVIEFSGKFEPVKWECRAPMPNVSFSWKNCGRDKTGQVTNIEEKMKLQEQHEKEQQERPDWQDPVLLAELKKQTGVDLKMPERTKNGRLKRKTKKHPGLTDLKQHEKTSFNRLSKKVFKKSTMMRVARALDRADQRRYRDKYGDQFNYMYDR